MYRSLSLTIKSQVFIIMNKLQAEQQVEKSLSQIIPTIRLLNHQTRFGQSVAELKWSNNTRYLPIVDQTISSQSVMFR